MSILAGRRVVVTGGAGFIGSHVADAYLEEGCDVLIVDNLSNGSTENLPRAAAFEKADLSDVRRIEALFKSFRPDVVCHHAAQIDVARSVADPVMDLKANIESTVRLLMLSVQSGVAGFLFASSGGAIYGDTATHAVPETAPKSPISPYGASKLAIEGYLLVFRRTYGLNACSLRYANVYGPRQGSCGEGGVVSIFARKMLGKEDVSIFGDGGQTRDFIFAKDAAIANVYATRHMLEHEVHPSSIDDIAFNISTGIGTSIHDLAGRIGEMTKYARRPMLLSPREGDIYHSTLAPEKAVSILHLAPPNPLAQGLRQTVEWFGEHRES